MNITPRTLTKLALTAAVAFAAVAPTANADPNAPQNVDMQWTTDPGVQMGWPTFVLSNANVMQHVRDDVDGDTVHARFRVDYATTPGFEWSIQRSYEVYGEPFVETLGSSTADGVQTLTYTFSAVDSPVIGDPAEFQVAANDALFAGADDIATHVTVLPPNTDSDVAETVGLTHRIGDDWTSLPVSRRADITYYNPTGESVALQSGSRVAQRGFVTVPAGTTLKARGTRVHQGARLRVWSVTYREQHAVDS